MSGIIGGKGLFKKTEDASSKYNEAKAREVLETVLLTDGQFEKNTNPEYNQDDFLDELIKKEIPGSKVIEDVAIIGGEYAYELDRSVPKIGRYVGKENDLIWPTVDATVKLADDKKDATITITASEEKQGIKKIEIWLLGEMIKEYKYDPAKPEATEKYIATQNGEYTIKVYGDLMASKTVEVTGIVPEIEFEPNGSEEWKKEHSTKIIVKKTAEKIKNMKYVWTNSVTEPADNTFTENCKDGDTITKNGVTGIYYLWVWLETEGGATAKRRSEAFYFDNEGPKITEFTATKYSIDGITLNITAQDTKSGIVKVEFYIDGVIQSNYTQTCTATTESINKTVNITKLSTGTRSCKVVVYDEKDNNSSMSITGNTMLYAWTEYEPTYRYELRKSLKYDRTTRSGALPWGTCRNEPAQSLYFNTSTGAISEYDPGYNGQVFYNNLKSYVGQSSWRVLGSTLYCYTINRFVEDSNNNNPMEVRQRQWRLGAEAIITGPKSGTGKIVTSNSSTTYPDNGASGRKVVYTSSQSIK